MKPQGPRLLPLLAQCVVFCLLSFVVASNPCVAANERAKLTFRANVLYFSATPEGRIASEETAKLFGGTQAVDCIDLTDTKLKPVKPLSTGLPKFPENLRAVTEKVEVTVAFVVNQDGKVINAAVKHSTNALFNEAALAAVLKWKFRPASRDGKELCSLLTVPVSFN